MPDRNFSVTLEARVAPYVAAMKSAESATSKFGIAGSSSVTKLGSTFGTLSPMLKAGVIGAVSAAGTAVAGFAVKSVKDFQSTALGAGQLSASLGITTQEASRLQEVALDLGIGVSTVERGIGRMNREVANSPEKFAAIRAEIAKTESGATDVTQTFLNVIDALHGIPDPAQRAAAAQAILGRGWQDLSRLIAAGADDLTAKLASVEAAKIMTPEQVEQAERFRDVMDELGGVAESVSLMIGEKLVPALTDMGEALKSLEGPLGVVKSGFDFMTGSGPGKWVYENIAPWKQFQTRLEGVKNVIGDVSDAFTSDMEGSFDPEPLKRYNANLSLVAITLGSAAGAVKALGDNTAGATTHAAQEHADMLIYEANAARDAANRSAALKTQLELAATAEDTATAAAQAHVTALQDLAAAHDEQVGGFRSAADAAIDLAESQKRVMEVAGDEEATTNDLVTAVRDAADGQVALKAAHLQSQGATLGALGALDSFNQSLLTQASQLQGPQRQAVMDYIARVNGIPAKKASEILALIDQGKLTEARQKLDDTSKARDAAVIARAETAAAHAALDELERPRYATLSINVKYNAALGVIGQTRASGGPVGAGQMYMVGEQGPEMFVPETDGRIMSTSATGRLSRKSPRFAGASPQVKHLLDEADALVKLADAEEDAAKKADLLAKAQEKAERAADLHAAAVERTANGLEHEADILHAHADALRKDAQEARQAAQDRASALRDQSGALLDAVDAEMALQDAQRAAADAAGHARRAFQTEGVSQRQRTEALEEARRAALALADAEVERARSVAASHGRVLSLQRATEIRQASLQRQAGNAGGAVGANLRDLLRDINFPLMFRLQQQAARTLERGRDRAADLRHDARQDDKNAHNLQTAANSLHRLAEQLGNARVSAAGGIHYHFHGNAYGEQALQKYIRQTVNETVRAARAGSR